MQDYIQERVLQIAAYIVEYRCTVRQAATVFNVSKSTVHKDVTERLSRLNNNLAREVRAVLNANKAERHLRGGEATRKKYKEPRVS
ncbi:MAG: putative DeoR family transcriptional regulator, stage sporulation protein [Moorella sp. (in: firmicutes)]|jgi:putative DeoR family transcriptional regulator (stage III sporulation protein D)|nr:putative DeoR family transcriptional regulator, stage sporulation protein [Moorella sp. (in: firmicutes)]MDK2894258.1 putative DeoR family transcriptional regulator, stage sporulation protein [Moorella sp. (in: firmicutes)]